MTVKWRLLWSRWINRILMAFHSLSFRVVFLIIGDVVPEERLPSADGWTRRVFERRTFPCTRTNAIHSGDELKPFKTRAIASIFPVPYRTWFSSLAPFCTRLHFRVSSLDLWINNLVPSFFYLFFLFEIDFVSFLFHFFFFSLYSFDTLIHDSCQYSER